jgi:ATP-binding cassette, subfamily C, bacterial EexD
MGGVRREVASGPLARVISESRRDLALAALFSAAANLLLLTPAIYMMQVYDRVLSSRSEVTLLMLTLILVGLLAAMAVLEAMRGQILVRIGTRFDRRVTGTVFPLLFDPAGPEARAARGQALQQVAQIRQFIAGPGLFGLFDLPWMVIYVVLLFIIHPLLGGIALVAALAILALALASERATRGRLTEAAGQMTRANAFLDSSLRHAETVGAMGMQREVHRRWQSRQESALRLQAEASDWSALLTGASKYVMLVTQSLLLGAGALLAIEAQISPGLMIAASIVGGKALQPIQIVVGQWNALVLARLAWLRLDGLLRQQPPPPERMSLPRAQGALAALNLSIAPPGAPAPLLEGLQFEIAPRETLGVIGPSGAGKTALARALAGAWPHQGELRLDGVDLRLLAREEFGPQIGYLPQDVQLFDGTIAENIARLGPVESERVIAAARAARVHDMILGLPEGYDTPIGEAGARLSGGQRQRIGLARALYGEPALLILDEPNANLDDAGEAQLMETLRAQKAAGRSIVLITHRPNALLLTDKVLVLREGQQVFFGGRDEALSRFVRRPTPQAAGRPG